MAKDETGKDLLQTLTSDRLGDLPARRDERGVEPVDLDESSRETERGKSPEEVVGEREARKTPAADEDKEAKLPQKYKVRVDDGSGEPVVKELTIEQLQKDGLLDKLLTSANQLPGLSRKHQELLERVAGKELPPKPAVAPPAKAPPTPAQIRSIYDAVAQKDVQLGYIEPDFAEAYPQMVAQLMYWRDLIENYFERLNAVVEWIKAETGQRNVNKVMTVLDNAIEVVAKKGDGDKGDPLFKDLRKPEVWDAFVEWMRTDLDPKIGSLTPENVEKFWIAFNSDGILDLTKEAAKKIVEPSPSKRRAAGDGTGSRLGGPSGAPKEKSLLERMSETRLGPNA